MWAILGLKRLIANNYKFSETDSTLYELQRYKVESNSALLFLEECCEVAGSVEVYRDEMFTRYKDYCINAKLKPVPQINFNKEIEGVSDTIERGLEKSNRRRIWKGVRLVNDTKG